MAHKKSSAGKAVLVNRSKPLPSVVEQLQRSLEDIKAGRIRKAIH